MLSMATSKALRPKPGGSGGGAHTVMPASGLSPYAVTSFVASRNASCGHVQAAGSGVDAMLAKGTTKMIAAACAEWVSAG